MAFGWEMVTAMDETLVECSGPAFGTALLFQAEGYGALSDVRFNEQYKYEYDYGHSMLQPDWDVIAQLTTDAKKYLHSF
eukprot:3798708-Ditylum_brightwellii.AAC.1